MLDFSRIQTLLEQVAKEDVEGRIRMNIIEEKLIRIETGIEQLIIQQAKTDVQLAETDAQLARTDAQLAETDAQLARTDAQLAKTDARLEKMIALQEQNNKKMGSIENNMGSTAEEFFYYALEKNKKLGNIKFDQIDLNLNGRVQKTQDEFDIVMYNGKAVAIIEIKYKVHKNDLENLVHKKTEHFKTIFPYYKNHQIYLGIGGYSMPKAVADNALKMGIAVLRQKGEIVEIDSEKLKAY